MSKQKIDLSIGFLLSHTNLALLRQINRNFNSAGFDITIEQMSLLMYLFYEDGKTQKELSEKNIKGKVSITKIVDNLVKRELVKRVSDKKDRRVKRIYITEKGKKIVPALKKIILDTNKMAFKGIKKEEIKILIKILSDVNKKLTNIDLLKFIETNNERWK
jgi:DNA-binding MarR family transcriptional regulator